MATHQPTRPLPPRTARTSAEKRIREQVACEVEVPLPKHARTTHAGVLRIPPGCPAFTLSDRNVYPKPLALDRVLPAAHACEQNASARLECMVCSKECGNMRLQQRDEWPQCKVRKTDGCGFGYFAPKTGLPRGKVIGQYTGKVFQASQLTDSKKQVYIMKIDSSKGVFVDARDVGYYTRFMNHSCAPNCEVQKWQVCGLPCAGIFALRDIEPREELTFDYGVNFRDAKAFVCKCPKCSP